MKVKRTCKDDDEQFQMATLACHSYLTSSFMPSRNNPAYFYLLAIEDCVKLCSTLEFPRKRIREGIFAMICRRSALDGYLRLFPGFPKSGYSRNFEKSAKKGGANCMGLVMKGRSSRSPDMDAFLMDTIGARGILPAWRESFAGNPE